MICHKYKIIFVHIPKTAGTSMESMFGKVEIKNQNYFTEMTQPGKHWTVQKCQEEYPEHFNSYYKWTIVRDPWHREVSIYNMMRNQIKYRHMSFKQFLKEVTVPQVKDDKLPVFKNQIKYITIDGDIHLDKIIRYEYLEEGWKQICKSIGKEHQKLNRLRHLTKEPISNFYDQESIDIVSEIRKEDIKFLKYDMPQI